MTMSKLETSVAKTSEEPTSKRGLEAAFGGLQAAAGGVVGGVVEFIGFHLTKGAVQVAEVKQTRQEIAQMAAHVKTAKREMAQMAEHVKIGKGEISQIAADVNTAKLAILAGLCLCGFCAAGSLLKNIFQRGNGGGNDRGDAGVQRQPPCTSYSGMG